MGEKQGEHDGVLRLANLVKNCIHLTDKNFNFYNYSVLLELKENTHLKLNYDYVKSCKGDV